MIKKSIRNIYIDLYYSSLVVMYVRSLRQYFFFIKHILNLKYTKQKYLTNNQPNIFYMQKKLTNNQPNISYKQKRNNVTCYVIN